MFQIVPSVVKNSNAEGFLEFVIRSFADNVFAYDRHCLGRRSEDEAMSPRPCHWPSCCRMVTLNFESKIHCTSDGVSHVVGGLREVDDVWINPLRTMRPGANLARSKVAIGIIPYYVSQRMLKRDPEILVSKLMTNFQ